MAARMPDPHNLQSMTASSQTSDAVIQTDLMCPGCGYNLRGLPFGSRCPECGSPSIFPIAIDEPLALMPRRVIVSFIRGCWVACICTVLMLAVVISNRFVVLDQKLLAPSLGFVALMWLGATIWLTPGFTMPQAVWRGFSTTSRLRISSRRLQVGWVVAAGCAVTAAFYPNAPSELLNVLAVIRWTGLIAGLSGFIVLCLLLENLAQWTRDDSAERMFNWAMWTVPLLTIFSGGSGGINLGGGFYRFQIIVLILWLVAVATFPYGLLSLSKSVTLSILHSLEQRDRAERKAERRRGYEDEATRSVQRMDASRGPDAD